MDYFGSQDTILWCKYASKDKTAFVKFKINNNFKQNIDETDSNNLESIGKSIPVPAYGF